MMMQTTYGITWHQTAVAKIEDGSRKVKLMEAYALADMYGIPLDELAAGRNLEVDRKKASRRENCSKSDLES